MKDIKKYMAIFKSLAAIAIVLVVIACGCKKTVKYVPIDASVMKYFWYSTGTYWVYRDSITGETDSICVYNTEDEIVSDNTGNVERRRSYINVYTNNAEAGGGRFDYKYYVVGYSIYFNSDSTSVDDPAYLFSYPFVTSASRIDGNKFGDVYTYLGSVQPYTFNGNAFDSVAIMNHSDSNKTYSDDFYITKAAGIVKMRLNHYPHLRVLELERYKMLH